MSLPRTARRPIFTILALLSAFVPLTAARAQSEPRFIQPGAPGEPGREISADEASDLASVLFTDADVEFMQGMIRHHAQALEMTDLIEKWSENAEMQTLAKRIELSQRDEIEMMQEWLRRNGQEVAPLGSHSSHEADLMPGMLTREQMSRLERARGGELDRLFLELMIAHHRGALVMVEDLLSTPGAAQESTVYGFTAEITADQSMEIDRMAAMLVGLSSDPRVGLEAGFLDAGQAASNVELVAAVPKPPGFFSPHAPKGLPVPPAREDEDEDEETAASSRRGGEEDEPEGGADGEKEKRAEAPSTRGASILNFASSDLAFSGDVLFNGNFHGFNTYDIEDPAAPRLLVSVVCPGGQGDLSVVGDLLIMSVEQTRGRLDCGLEGVVEPASEARFRGVRIFDLSDLTTPRQVAAVQTCRGSHTHTVVTDPDDDGIVYVYGSGTSSVRPGEELTGCSDEPPDEDENTALFSIDVIRIPVDRPQEARIVARPRIFADPESGAIAGLWKGGDHGVGTQKTSETKQCHDITVFAELGLAAGACSGNGILLDVSDPENPVRLDQVADPGFAYWHSATFNNDGTKVIFTDEWGGGLRPRCRATDPPHWGADAIFDIVDRKLELRSYFKMPAPQSERENCVAHNGSLVPIPGRDVMVQAWYQGGISVFDFTDSSHPVEIAFFDRGPIDADELILGGHWSAYWYDGYIYATEIARGLDVLRLLPSEYLSRSELDAAALIGPDVFNPQHQRRIEWPASPIVARAVLDQIERRRGLPPDRLEALRAILERAEQILTGAREDGGETSGRLETLAAELERDGAEAVGVDQSRLRSLAETVRGVADRLR